MLEPAIAKAGLAVRHTREPRLRTWFKISKYFSHHTIERCLWFLVAKFCSQLVRRSPRTSVLKTGTPVESENLTNNLQSLRNGARQE